MFEETRKIAHKAVLEARAKEEIIEHLLGLRNMYIDEETGKVDDWREDGYAITIADEIDWIVNRMLG